jgi:hypothetical protein
MTHVWLAATSTVLVLLKFSLVWSLFRFSLFSHPSILGIRFWGGVALGAALVGTSLRETRDHAKSAGDRADWSAGR